MRDNKTIQFSKFASLCQRLEDLSSSNAIRIELAKFFQEIPPSAVKYSSYFLLGMIGPKYADIDLGLGERTAIRITSRAFDAAEEDVKLRFASIGDLGDAAQTFSKREHSSLKIDDVYDALHKFKSISGSGSQEARAELLAELLQKASALEAKYIMRIALGSMRLGVGEAAVLDAFAIAFAGGMNEEMIRKQWKEIDGIAEKHEIKVLKGAEVDILKDGELDYPPSVLKELDIVIGSVHSSFKMPRVKMTERILKALEDKYLDILGHPTGRLIGKRPPYDADYPRIFKAAAENGKVLEIDGQPERMDLNDSNILAAREHGAKFCIDTDSKSTSNLGNMRYGLGMARRGWLTRDDVVNTYPYDKLSKVFKKLSQ